MMARKRRKKRKRQRQRRVIPAPSSMIWESLSNRADAPGFESQSTSK